MSLSPVLFFLAGRKSYFAAGVTLRSHEADLFSAFFPLNTGFDLWCDAVCSIFSWEVGVVLGMMFAGLFVAGLSERLPHYRPSFLGKCNFRDPNWVTFYLNI